MTKSRKNKKRKPTKNGTLKKYKKNYISDEQKAELQKELMWLYYTKTPAVIIDQFREEKASKFLAAYASLPDKQYSSVHKRASEELWLIEAETLIKVNINVVLPTISEEKRHLIYGAIDDTLREHVKGVHGKTTVGLYRKFLDNVREIDTNLAEELSSHFEDEIGSVQNDEDKRSSFIVTGRKYEMKFPFSLSEDQTFLEREKTSSGKPQDKSVENYMNSLQDCFRITRNFDENMTKKRDAIFLYNCMKEARIFHFDADFVQMLSEEVGPYIIESVCGLDWEEYIDLPNLSLERQNEYSIRVGKVASESGYPEKFPFECVLLAYGDGIPVSVDHLNRQAPEDIRDSIVEGYITSHLMTDDGHVFSIVKALNRDASGGLSWSTWFEPMRSGGLWNRVTDTEPWICSMLINIINEHRTFVIENNMPSNLRKEYKDNRKGMGHKDKKQWGYTPPPFYTLKLKNKIIKERIQKAFRGPRKARSYKTDVRGHERCRIRRGPLPMEPETAAKLRKRDYKIFTVEPLDQETLRRLHERGIPFKKSDEWLAIKTSWVDSYLSSHDPKLPYIPAVRTTGSLSVKPKKVSNSWINDPRDATT